MKSKSFLLAVLFLISVGVEATGQPPPLQERLKEARAIEIQATKKKIAGFQDELRKANRYTSAEIRLQLGMAKHWLSSLQNEDIPFNVKLIHFDKGNFGILDDTPRVMQVVDEDEAIVEVVESISYQSQMAQPQRRPTKYLLWIKGVSTANISDSRLWPEARDYYFICTGTQQYDTITGKRTVPLLEKYGTASFYVPTNQKATKKRRYGSTSTPGYGVAPR